MARHYVKKNPAGTATPVSDDQLEQARARAEAAAERLRAAEGADPSAAGWETEYEIAAAAVRATSRRVEALEQLRAAQVERGGQRAKTAMESAKELDSIAAALGASRDQVAAAAAGHLRTLAALASAAAGHNARLAEARAAISAKGLRVRDDLIADGQDHEEGVLDAGGLRAGGIDWLPVDAGGLTAHAVRQVFSGYGPGHPLAEVGKYRWRAHEVERRADQLQVPVLADTGAALPPVPERAAAVPAPHEMIPPVLAPQDGIYRDPPRRGKAAR